MVNIVSQGMHSCGVVLLDKSCANLLPLCAVMTDNLEDLIKKLETLVSYRENIQKDLETGFSIKFDVGLSEEEKDSIVEVIVGMANPHLAADGNNRRALRGMDYHRRLSCSEQTACYVASCWVPIVGVACLACKAIDCP